MKKLSDKTKKILMALFALCAIVMAAATTRSLCYGSLIYAVVHAAGLVVFFVTFLVFSKDLCQKKYPKRSVLICSVAYGICYFLATVLMLGFYCFLAFMIVSIVWIALPFLGLFSVKEYKKSLIAFSSALVILFIMAIPGYFYRIFEITNRERTQELYISEENGYFAHGLMPETLYIYTEVPTTTADVMLHNSLQALTCRKFTDQIIYEKDVTDVKTSAAYTKKHLETIQKYFPDIKQERIGSQEMLLKLYDGKVENYILYDDGDRESLFVAANLCYQMDAVMVGKSIVSVAKRHDWKMVFDATGWTEKDLMKSEYFKNIDNHIMVMMDPFIRNKESYGQDVILSQMWDNAMLNNAWMVYNDFSLPELERHLKKMKRNSVCFGGVQKGSAENSVVRACARYGVTFIYGRYTANLSVLSGLDITKSTVDTDVLTAGEMHKVELAPYSEDSVPKHTVCVMLSDADNIRFCTEQALNPSYYQSPLRDDTLRYNCGFAGSMAEIAPILLLEFYDWMSPTNDFCYQLSSIGYTYPSHWTDKEAWEQVVKSLVRVMKKSQNTVLEIMDDSAFMGAIDVPSHFSSMKKYFDTYTKYDEIDGCLFIDYTQLYAGYQGEVCWSNGKPVVSAKYSVWWDEKGVYYRSEKNDIDYIVNEINHASTDKTSLDAYTFIIVHGWSGLDEDGNLVGLSLGQKGVDNTAIFKKLQDSFDDDVEMVGTTEFINRIRRNVKPK